ncbi:unnamed protein product [Dicrocoelium dendriticum]|nr:unnamed protein product [Dicrocoelium dendriticum]
MRTHEVQNGRPPTLYSDRSASYDRSRNSAGYKASIFRSPGRKRKKSSKDYTRIYNNSKGNTGTNSSHDATLCPENYRVKLADFGFSKLTAKPDVPLTTFCGSPAYAAPELFEAKDYRGGPVDMWAMGIVLFFLLTGLLPYRGNTVGMVRRLVLEDRGLRPQEWLSPTASALYLQLTSRSPDDRPTAAQLINLANCAAGQRKRSSTGKSEARGEQRNIEGWSTWLAGQRFPKDLPRFNRCAPILCSLRGGPSLNSIGTTSLSTISHSNQYSEVQRTSETKYSDEMVSGSTCTSISMGLSEAEEADVPCELRPIGKPLNKKTLSCGDCNDEAELEAARLLLGLGVSKEEIAGAKNLESRSAVTGAYRIILHQRHRARRLSRLDTLENTDDAKINQGIFSSVPDRVSEPEPSLGTTVTQREAPLSAGDEKKGNTRKRCSKRHRLCTLL